jgi:hypothetical protein
MSITKPTDEGFLSSVRTAGSPERIRRIEWITGGCVAEVPQLPSLSLSVSLWLLPPGEPLGDAMPSLLALVLKPAWISLTWFSVKVPYVDVTRRATVSFFW